MRFILTAACAFVLASCARVPTQTPHNSISAALESKTVALVVQRDADARSYCTGVWVGANAILTANHCVDDLDPGERVEYVTRGDLSASSADELEAIRFGDVTAHDEDADLALIVVKLPPAHGVASIATENPYVGETTLTMGHPLGLWYSYSTGVVSAVRKWDGDLWLVQTTAPISPGNSGGALFNEAGELLGIGHAYVPRGENLNFYVHAGHVRVFLNQALRG